MHLSRGLHLVGGEQTPLQLAEHNYDVEVSRAVVELLRDGNAWAQDPAHSDVPFPADTRDVIYVPLEGTPRDAAELRRSSQALCAVERSRWPRVFRFRAETQGL